MAAKKVKKTTKKKVYKKSTSKKRSIESRTISFLVGIVTVLILAVMVFIFAQGNNYKTVLGTQTLNQYEAPAK